MWAFPNCQYHKKIARPILIALLPAIEIRDILPQPKELLEVG